ncbi:zinc ribbon domain-containing protein [Fannyhessea vaginae]|uniref:zinc ribbon domain-containing protein n=1 Tax=Fannyhessea vaginae TaxID=82135 RepID=UPI0028896D4B|nr:zinc ribbon domain-containing protein [Fannyhessea vaginae]
MQCERCGAPREDDARVCARCGNEFSQPSVEDTSIPSIDTFGVEPQVEQKPLQERVSAQKNAPAQEGTPTSDNTTTDVPADASPSSEGGFTDADMADIVEPVFNPVITPTQDSAVTTVAPVVTPHVTASPQMSASVPEGQNTNAKSFFASKKNRNLAFIGAAVVVVLIIAFNVFNYFSGLISPNDVKLILSKDSDLMQNGVIQSQFVNSLPYLVKDVAIEEQKDVTADIRNGYGDVPTAAAPTHVMRARIKATIASENFETTFVTNILVSKTSEGWKALYPISTLPKDATTKPLKGVDKPSNTSSEVSYSESDLQENDGTYTSTVTANKHVKKWYGDAVYSWADVYKFSNDKGWYLEKSTNDDAEAHIEWSIKGKTYEYVNKLGYFRNDNISLTINDINDDSADITYSIASEPESKTNGNSINLSGRKTAKVTTERGDVKIELNDAENGVSILIRNGGNHYVAGRGEVKALFADIKTQSDEGSLFGGKYSVFCSVLEKAQ